MIPYLTIVLSFLLGSIPFGLLVAKAKGVDIRQVGSGNIGATNVARALGKKAGIAVLFLDVAKGWIPAALAPLVSPGLFGLESGHMGASFGILAGFAAILGHILSPFLNFRGGKGIATGLGMLLGIAPAVAAIALGGFILVVLITRYVSVASLFASLCMVGAGLWLMPGEVPYLIVFGLVACFVFVRHTDNIKRLAKGTEKKFSFSSSSNQSESQGSVERGTE